METSRGLKWSAPGCRNYSGTPGHPDRTLTELYFARSFGLEPIKSQSSWSARRSGVLALVLIIIASLRIVSTYKVLSHTTDEPAHLAAGIEWIENGTYTYEDQHPPLARVVGAFGAHWAGSRWSRNPDLYLEGFHLLGQNNRYTRVLFFSRLSMLPFFWIGAAAVYFWGLRIGGPSAAMFATLLFTTTPPILAHAGLVTTDMALTAFVSAALVASIYWAEKPNGARSVALGILLGLALLSKFSALVFLPAAWLLMYGIDLLKARHAAIGRLAKLAPWFAVSMIVAALVIWAGYRFAVGRVEYLHAILPAPAFFTGIWYVYLHNSVGHLAYLLGKRSQTGFWYYYPVVLTVKTPLATLILIFAAICFAISRRDHVSIACPLALIAALLGIGLFSHINIGVRHILPVYMGFAVCGGAALARMFSLKRSWMTLAASALLLWQVISGALKHPDYIAYTNELAGRDPEKILADSDLDWGQGLRGLALRLHELGVRSFTLKLDNWGYMIASGEPFPAYVAMPDGDHPNPGWNAVSVTAWKLSGQPKWADTTKPTERVRRSMYLYYFPSQP
jgi:4-amino-4-deoxy-L-arabinose transferase-like glycosyltransferase